MMVIWLWYDMNDFSDLGKSEESPCEGGWHWRRLGNYDHNDDCLYPLHDDCGWLEVRWGWYCSVNNVHITVDRFSDRPHGSLLWSYDRHYCEDDDCPYPHPEIFSDRPSCSLLRQQSRIKAGLWTCQGAGGGPAVKFSKKKKKKKLFEILALV